MRFIQGHNNRAGLVDYIEDPATGCWVWQRRVTTSGYGFFDGPKVGGRRTAICAHRFYYEKHRGPIPTGLELDHLCRNRACVNPDHLEPVTSAENHRRGAAAKLTAEQVQAIRASGESDTVLAQHYGVARSHIYAIRHRRKWRDLPQPPELAPASIPHHRSSPPVGVNSGGEVVGRAPSTRGPVPPSQRPT